MWRLGIFGFRPDGDVRFDHIVARSTHDDVDPRCGANRVVTASLTAQRADDATGRQAGVGIVCEHNFALIAQQGIVAAADGDQVVRRAGDHEIDAVLQRDHVFATETMINTASDIERPIAVEERFAVVTKDDVGSSASGDDVVTDTTDDGVNAAGQFDDVSVTIGIIGVAADADQCAIIGEGHRTVIAHGDTDVIGRTA